ncbi:MAG: aminoacyl-tRNA hydrolase [Candidatus Hydrogenedentes bacterium]|nr:aminoacyl-tRNA hydrolase [Candidatus Hydrogenedentota bacterium]
MKVIVGLGNPGPKYRNTRHNLGFVVLDLLADQLGGGPAREKCGGLVVEAQHGAERLMLVKPLTFMNRSGDCVAPLVRNKISSPQDLLVVTDDVNLPLGRLRLRAGGSAGGHNGLKSLIERLGSQEFPRVRMGVGESGGRDLADHVLSRFHPDEMEEVAEMVKRAAEAVLCFVAQGIEKAMNQYN